MSEQTTIKMFQDHNEKNWSPDNAVIALTFKVMWSASLPLDRIERIGAALADLKEVNLQDSLTALVKAKVLRARSIRGVRHYEVNY